MTGANPRDDDHPFGGVDESELYGEDQLNPTPEQHERLKNGLHGSLFDDIRRAERRYLVVGSGTGETGERRRAVCNRLDRRLDAIAFRLEDFGFTGDELDLWAPAFDVLSGMASHIVGVIEDYDGGHVWELGFLYHQQTTVRDHLWVLKRIYDDETVHRERYDNGMAASHLTVLENAVSERVLTWRDTDELFDAIDSLP